MRVWQIVLAAVAIGTAVPVALHHHAYGWNPHEVGLAFFLWLNAIIALWELCLLVRIGAFEREHEGLRAQWRGRELAGVASFFGARLTFPIWGMAVSIAMIESGSYALVR